LLKNIESIAEHSEGIPRPDHIIQKNESKHYLWSVGVDDDIVKRAISSIKDEIQKNLDIALKAIALYDEVVPLLTDHAKVM